MWRDMNKEVKKNWYTEYKLLGSMISVLCIGTIITACSKNTPADEPNPTAISNSAPASSTQPTGLVKNPISHNKVADVTQWMDQASTKTAAQLAQEEKLAKEQKEVKATLPLANQRQRRSPKQRKANQLNQLLSLLRRRLHKLPVYRWQQKSIPSQSESY